ncbi:hypothetical protein MTO96_018797 [Rhipicephalus appendiculatus]
MLAFENSICVDYVTEKLFRPLDHYLVPVVFGGANYSERAPPHSYIDALSFESPESLAEYLRELSDNYTEYASYFKWKESYEIEWVDAFCKLCTKLHNRAEVQRVSSYDDIRIVVVWQRRPVSELGSSRTHSSVTRRQGEAWAVAPYVQSLATAAEHRRFDQSKHRRHARLVMQC